MQPFRNNFWLAAACQLILQSFPALAITETCYSICALAEDLEMKRYASVIKVKLDRLEEYKRCHEAVWPEVLATIRACNIRNYSIFLKDNLLFGYFEYHGSDFAADMARMAADPKTQEWWAVMQPMQQPLDSRASGEWWADMQEVFHTD